LKCSAWNLKVDGGSFSASNHVPRIAILSQQAFASTFVTQRLPL
jgi:hypothetical protein